MKLPKAIASAVAGTILPYTMSAGMEMATASRAMAVRKFARELENRPKKPFKSPATHSGVPLAALFLSNIVNSSSSGFRPSVHR